jgi:hypothetical protein
MCHVKYVSTYNVITINTLHTEIVECTPYTITYVRTYVTRRLSIAFIDSLDQFTTVCRTCLYSLETRSSHFLAKEDTRASYLLVLITTIARPIQVRRHLHLQIWKNIDAFLVDHYSLIGTSSDNLTSSASYRHLLQPYHTIRSAIQCLPTKLTIA